MKFYEITCCSCGEVFMENNGVETGDTVTCKKCGSVTTVGIPLPPNRIVAKRSARYIIEKGFSEDDAIDHVCHKTKEKDIKEFCKNLEEGNRNALKILIRDEIEYIKVIQRDKSKPPND